MTGAPMTWTVMISSLVIIVCLGLLMAPTLSSGGRKNRKAAAARGEAARIRRNPYQSVSVIPGQSACEEVRKLADRRFLSNEAPLIPLAECGGEKCSCKYVHHEDRRDRLSERRLPASLSTELYAQAERPERRMQTGRRSSDWQAA